VQEFVCPVVGRLGSLEFSGAMTELSPTSVFDPAAILGAIGEVPYVWDIATDALAWGPNAREILMIADAGAIATGRSFARFFDLDNLITRFDAVTQSSHQDDGRGVPYHLE
jgi:hypothetical protein